MPEKRSFLYYPLKYWRIECSKMGYLPIVNHTTKDDSLSEFNILSIDSTAYKIIAYAFQLFFICLNIQIFLSDGRVNNNNLVF